MTMALLLPAVLLLAPGCRDKAAPADSSDPPPPTTGDDTDGGGGDGGGGGDTDLPDGVTTVDFSGESNPELVTELSFEVTFSGPATAAVACTLDSDWGQLHLAESSAAAERHTIRVGGLLPGSDYTCVAAPTSVTEAAPMIATARTADLAAGCPPPPPRPTPRWR